MDDVIFFEKTEDARTAVFQSPNESMPEKLCAYLSQKNIKTYTHQAEAYDAVRRGENIIVTTPTASGKTLSCLLPVFAKLLEIPDATALLIYPTKALTRDQLLTIQEMDSALNARTRPAIYDGDTKQEVARTAGLQSFPAKLFKTLMPSCLLSIRSSTSTSGFRSRIRRIACSPSVAVPIT